MAQPLFQAGERDKLRRHFGEDFYRRLIAVVDEYTGRWSLRELRFLPSYSANARAGWLSSPLCWMRYNKGRVI